MIRRFFSRPKVLKDTGSVAVWPYIVPVDRPNEGMSFNPFRTRGCFHWVALLIVFWIFAALAGMALDVVGLLP